MLITHEEFKKLKEEKKDNISFLMYRKNISTNEFYYFNKNNLFTDNILKITIPLHYIIDHLILFFLSLNDEEMSNTPELTSNIFISYTLDLISKKLINSQIKLDSNRLYQWENIDFTMEYSSYMEGLMVVLNEVDTDNVQHGLLFKNQDKYYNVEVYYTETIFNNISDFLTYYLLAIDEVNILPENLDLIDHMRNIFVKFVLEFYFLINKSSFIEDSINIIKSMIKSNNFKEKKDDSNNNNISSL